MSERVESGTPKETEIQISDFFQKKYGKIKIPDSLLSLRSFFIFPEFHSCIVVLYRVEYT